MLRQSAKVHLGLFYKGPAQPSVTICPFLRAEGSRFPLPSLLAFKGFDANSAAE
jgi:hypothetical protein